MNARRSPDDQAKRAFQECIFITMPMELGTPAFPASHDIITSLRLSKSDNRLDLLPFHAKVLKYKGKG